MCITNEYKVEFAFKSRFLSSQLVIDVCCSIRGMFCFLKYKFSKIFFNDDVILKKIYLQKKWKKFLFTNFCFTQF